MIACALITDRHIGALSKPGWSGSEPMAVGYTMSSAPFIGDPAQLREPLVVAGGGPNLDETQIVDREQVFLIRLDSWPEVVSLVITRAGGDVNFSRTTDQFALRPEHDCGIEVLAVFRLLEKGSHHMHPKFFA